MITGELKSRIDQIWNAFWSGGISNPLEVIALNVARTEGMLWNRRSAAYALSECTDSLSVQQDVDEGLVRNRAMLSERIEIRLSANRAARIRGAADASHRSLSDWIRSVLMARLADGSEDDGRERRLAPGDATDA